MQVEEEEQKPDLFLSSLRRSSFLETETAKQNMHQHIRHKLQYCTEKNNNNEINRKHEIQ